MSVGVTDLCVSCATAVVTAVCPIGGRSQSCARNLVLAFLCSQSGAISQTCDFYRNRYFECWTFVLAILCVLANLVSIGADIFECWT